MSSDNEGMSQSFSFSMGSGDARTVHDDAVEAFDHALEEAGDGDVNHFIDPQRIQTFESGGPPVWSVATVPTAGGVLYLSYGLSEAIDPTRIGVKFELSVVVPGEPTMWPALLLRALCRYMLASRRPLEVGQSMSFPDAVSRFFAAPQEQDQFPDTPMSAVIVAGDPLLSSIATERGDVEVRRVVGIHEDERALLDLWTADGFLGLVAQRDAALGTAIDRGSWADDPTFVSTVEEGSRKDGSEVSAVAVAGVRWWQDADKTLHVTFPGGAEARRILAMLEARLPFGHHLLVHDVDPEKRLAVAFEPGDALGFRNEEDTLVVRIPPGHELFDSFAQVGDGPSVEWSFTD